MAASGPLRMREFHAEPQFGAGDHGTVSDAGITGDLATVHEQLLCCGGLTGLVPRGLAPQLAVATEQDDRLLPFRADNVAVIPRTDQAGLLHHDNTVHAARGAVTADKLDACRQRQRVRLP